MLLSLQSVRLALRSVEFALGSAVLSLRTVEPALISAQRALGTARITLRSVWFALWSVGFAVWSAILHYSRVSFTIARLLFYFYLAIVFDVVSVLAFAFLKNSVISSQITLSPGTLSLFCFTAAYTSNPATIESLLAAKKVF